MKVKMFIPHCLLFTVYYLLFTFSSPNGLYDFGLRLKNEL